MQIIFNQAASAQLQIALSASDYNGYHISCFGMQDGSITATATGGQPPYLITWSTGDTATSISALAAGYYRAYVLDANNQVESAEITLNEPELLRIEPNVFQYPNGYEISLYGACNGSITVSATGGVSPYSYLWNDNNTSANRSALCAGNMYLVVTDANGCNASSDQITLRQPERSDWTLTGNAGSNPSINFIGTSDNKDLLIKTNSIERMNVTANGDVKINSLAGSGYQMLYADSNGMLKGGGNHIPATVCTGSQPPFWFTTNVGTNKSLWTCPDVQVGIGTYLIPAGYKLIVDGKVGVREIYVRSANNAWPDYVFHKNYNLISLADLEQYINLYNHLPGLPSANEIEKQGNFSLGDMQLKSIEKIEELTLYVLQLKKEVEELKKENAALKKYLK